MDSLFPFLQGLAPLQHVGLSRRTVNDRPLFSYYVDTMFVMVLAEGLLQSRRLSNRDPKFGGRNDCQRVTWRR